MLRSNDTVEEERPRVSSEYFLQQPAVQHNTSYEAATSSILEKEGEKIEEGIEGGTNEKMDCKDKQNIPLLQNASHPVSIMSQILANQSQACETENPETIKQDYRTDMPLNDTNVDPDHNPDSNLQCFSELPCPHCERRFTSRQGLERHIKAHALAASHTKQFKCSCCRRTFSTQFSQRRHERRHDNRNRKPGYRTETCTASQNVPGSGKPLNAVSLLKGDKASQNPDPIKYFNAADSEQKDGSDKISYVKALHICKYCKKAFRTCTSLKRHQRSIHERQLFPRGVCKKATVTRASEGQQLIEMAQDSQTVIPQCMEDIDQEREFMVDISSNISENLSFYIDGKIVSTSAVSNCELIEMNSGGSAFIGLNAVIISPAQITQALKLETNTCNLTPDLSEQSSIRRRTSTPPLLPQIKTQLESESILTTSSSSLSSLSLSPTSGTGLVTAHPPQSIETVAFHGEKIVYLSPKLKQLLHNQDGSKSAFAFIADGQKLGSPLSLTALPATTTRFKRRTTSPPSSLQQSPDLSVETVLHDDDSVKVKVLDLESRGTSPELSLSGNDEIEHLNPPTSDAAQMQQQILPLDCSVSRTGGNSCNQQPLDLSNSVSKQDSSEALEESILDLSIGGKNLDSDSAGGYLTQPAVKKSKPNSSMLQKVLMNEYGGVDIPSDEVQMAAGIFSAPEITKLAVVALSDSGPQNPEKLLFEISVPPASHHPMPPVLAPFSVHPAALIPSSQGSPSSTESYVSYLSTPAMEPSQEIQTLHSTLLVSDNVPPPSTVEDYIDNPVYPLQGDLKLTIPDRMTSATEGVAHTLIPTAPLLSLQSSHWVADHTVCELAQRTLVVDSVLASDEQIFSPSLPVNQPNITSLTFPPNTVVIEYTVALQSTENILPALQANSVHCLPDKASLDTTLQQEPHVPAQPQPVSPDTTPTPEIFTQSSPTEQSSGSTDVMPTLTASTNALKAESNEGGQDNLVCPASANVQTYDNSKHDNKVEDESSPLHSFCKNFMCNVCDQPFQSMKSLSQHVGEHSKEWPYKCEFCVQLFESDTGLLEHRSSYHGIGKIYVCKTCSKEFAFLCNLEQHQRDLHPSQECSHTEVVHGKLRPENHNSPKTDLIQPDIPITEFKKESDNTTLKAEEDDSENTTEELYTTIKIMASEGVKPKGPDVRLGINQHYPSFKPPPFPYHNRTPTGTTAASATNFTTPNIPQTFSTAIRCTKCGKSFDNMPELHKHILSCASASDKKRYTPKKNPIPLKQFAKAQNGVLSPAMIVNSRQNLSQKPGHLKKLNFHESPVKIKMSIMNKKKSQLVQKGRSAGVRKAFAQDNLGIYACPHCSRKFTYNASLKKHVAFSCPMRPASRKSMNRKRDIVLAQENNESLRRQIANISPTSQGSNQGAKTIIKSQINKPNTAADTTQDIRLKRSTILSTSVVQSSKKGKPISKGIFMPQLASKQIVLSSVAQVNSLRLREREGGPITRSVQQASTTITPLKQPDSHNIIMRPVLLQVKK
ncbi:PR domain zinc finger protein 2-like isoform X2 [Myxocyprinus asiaticus]|uniref:PR domain zinc finger protein 2-like isoform X2 n=1 Tax=Myxocyprinus asiaticus TaxID=70543 RepID=UPI002221BDAB|nr:PR domain zinc finger protein 2-like isoform X2 [Myxocyprinus asiaticus]